MVRKLCRKGEGGKKKKGGAGGRKEKKKEKGRGKERKGAAAHVNGWSGENHCLYNGLQMMRQEA